MFFDLITTNDFNMFNSPSVLQMENSKTHDNFFKFLNYFYKKCKNIHTVKNLLNLEIERITGLIWSRARRRRARRQCVKRIIEFGID